jgi:hypothetical protein
VLKFSKTLDNLTKQASVQLHMKRLFTILSPWSKQNNMTLHRFFGKAALFFLATGIATTEVNSLRAKTNATAASKRVNAVPSNAKSFSSSLRRVWISYEPGQHVTVLNNMDMHRINSVSMHPLYDFPSMNSIVTMASDKEIAALMANTSIGRMIRSVI